MRFLTLLGTYGLPKNPGFTRNWLSITMPPRTRQATPLAGTAAPLSIAPHPDDLRLWEPIYNTVHPPQPLSYLTPQQSRKRQQ
jgi:hypothetical protein